MYVQNVFCVAFQTYPLKFHIKHLDPKIEWYVVYWEFTGSWSYERAGFVFKHTKNIIISVLLDALGYE